MKLSKYFKFTRKKDFQYCIFISKLILLCYLLIQKSGICYIQFLGKWYVEAQKKFSCCFGCWFSTLHCLGLSSASISDSACFCWIGPAGRRHEAKYLCYLLLLNWASRQEGQAQGLGFLLYKHSTMKASECSLAQPWLLWPCMEWTINERFSLSLIVSLSFSIICLFKN